MNMKHWTREVRGKLKQWVGESAGVDAQRISTLKGGGESKRTNISIILFAIECAITANKERVTCGARFDFLHSLIAHVKGIRSK